MPNNSVNPGKNEVIDQWLKIGEKVFGDIPNLTEVHNPLAKTSSHLSPWSNQPQTVLFRYLNSFRDVEGHILYALDRLRFYLSKEASNTFEFYVSYYLYDFIVRTKTSTDLLALIINHLHGLEIPEKACSLEAGSFVGKLRSKHLNNPEIEKLAKIVDQARTSWLGAFDNVRDIVVHQSAFQFILIGNSKNPIHISIPLLKHVPPGLSISFDPNEPIKSLTPMAPKDVLIKFLVETRSGSVSEHLITADPIILCEELWKVSSKTANRILELCTPPILRLVQNGDS